MLTHGFIKQLINSFLSLLPILLVVLVFQIFVIRQPIEDVTSMVIGMVQVVLGLTLFVYGLEMSLFPIGESMAYAFARKGSVFWLLVFAFCLGFGTTVAEPALIAVAEEAANISSKGHLIAATEEAKSQYALWATDHSGIIGRFCDIGGRVANYSRLVFILPDYFWLLWRYDYDTVCT